MEKIERGDIGMIKLLKLFRIISGLSGVIDFIGIFASVAYIENQPGAVSLKAYIMAFVFVLAAVLSLGSAKLCKNEIDWLLKKK